MKIKILSLIMSATLLSACGGGSDGSSQSNSPTPDENTQNHPETQPSTSDHQVWHTYRIDYWYDNQTGDNDFETIQSKLTIASGKLYAELDDYDDNEYYLTEDGEYRGFGPINSHYGAEVGDIKLEKNRFKVRPYSTLGSKGLEFTQDHIELDLSGQPVLAHVDPQLNVNVSDATQLSKLPTPILNQLKNFQSLIFPAGSRCLQETQYANNQEYLTLYDLSLSHKNDFEHDEKSFHNQDPHYYKVTGFNQAVSYLYSYDAKAEHADSGSALYLGQYFSSYLEKQGVEYNLAEDIQHIKETANLITDSQNKAKELAYAEAKSKTCDLYNTTAADYLKKNVRF